MALLRAYSMMQIHTNRGGNPPFPKNLEVKKETSTHAGTLSTQEKGRKCKKLQFRYIVPAILPSVHLCH
jgi:hypothetical protein